MKKLIIFGFVLVIVIVGICLWPHPQNSPGQPTQPAPSTTTGADNMANANEATNNQIPNAASSTVQNTSFTTNSLEAYESNNLVQVGLAFKLWASSHHDQFPFNVSQADGGSREASHQDSDGFELNPAATFMVMTQELSSPKLLVCVNDNAKKPAANLASLTTNNISYRLRSGTNVSPDHPAEILLMDPFNSLALYCDGSVKAMNR